MQAGVAAKYAVVAVGVYLLTEHLALLHIGFAHLGKIAEVHIVVGRAMNEQQVAAQVSRTLYGVDSITRWVLLRGTHVTFGVHRVVVFPVAWSGHSHTGTEHLAAFAHRHQRVEATKAPAPDGYAVLVNIRQRAKVKCGLHLVFRLLVAKVEVGALFKVGTTRACAASVYTHKHKTLVGHVALPLSAGVETHVP